MNPFQELIRWCEAWNIYFDGFNHRKCPSPEYINGLRDAYRAFHAALTKGTINMPPEAE